MIHLASTAARGAARSAARKLIAVWLLSAGGCATLDGGHDYAASADAAVRECAGWYASLDAAVDDAGVRDAQTSRVAGFPYLRVDRFFASMRDAGKRDPHAMEALVDRLAALDLGARRHEISNLPAESLRRLWRDLGEPETSATLRRTRECGRTLRTLDMAEASRRDALLERLTVPDDYVDVYRLAGLYPLASIPFSAGVRQQQQGVLEAFGRALDAGVQGALIRYSPPSRPRVTREQLRGILARASYNGLRLPEPGHQDLETLYAHYAPIFEIETRGDHDRPGALRWRWSAAPQVDASMPAVYLQTSHARYGGASLLQLVYTVWFSERPARSSVDLLAGKLDGVVFRVTLAPDGLPVLYDTMHPCGCYHMFFTTPRSSLRDSPEGGPEWAFVPQALPEREIDERLVLRIASGTHYLERVYRERIDGLARYEFRPYDDLRSLPLMSGGTRSVFGADGFIPGTERAERFLFWPMGVANAGAMRQWGRHATAFVGRRHFDDADLIERRFVLDLK